MALLVQPANLHRRKARFGDAANAGNRLIRLKRRVFVRIAELNTPQRPARNAEAYNRLANGLLPETFRQNCSGAL